MITIDLAVLGVAFAYCAAKLYGRRAAKRLPEVLAADAISEDASLQEKCNALSRIEQRMRGIVDSPNPYHTAQFDRLERSARRLRTILN